MHSKEFPILFLGRGNETVEMYRGNFKIQDYVVERVPITISGIDLSKNSCIVKTQQGILLKLDWSDSVVTIEFEYKGKEYNRFWIRIPASEEEKCYGCGAQMSYFNLRGREFPLWSSEPGVGRDKSTYITWKSDVEGKAGGDYYNTNYPQTTFISTKKYFLHITTYAYANFDFRHSNFHELQVWEVPKRIRLEFANSYLDLAERVGEYFGKQPKLPEWIYNGVILGLQGGTDRVSKLTKQSIESGIPVAGVWCQDWEGKRETSFGKRLQWDWKWDERMYPDLPKLIKEYKKMGISFLGYINPYLVSDGALYKEGYEKGYFALDQENQVYLVDFGEFYCGVVDFTNPDAYEWFKGIIKKNLIEFGLDGWMADFGEYLPTDVKLFNGGDPMIEHNHWPAYWAQCNYEALEETGMLEKKIFFMRSGSCKTAKYCTLYWPGDQSVDFSIHDGLISVVSGALSTAVLGNGLYHSDIGGYTSLYGNIRTKELFLRWAEMAVFMPVMRTHEGNRPDTNFQYYDDTEVMKDFGRLVQIHVALKPYIKEAVIQNSEHAIPVIRPLFYHYHEQKCFEEQTEYLFGPDILVAPVYEEGKESRSVYLPDDQWIHLFTHQSYCGGEYLVEAPIGYPPVFFRMNSKFKEVLTKIKLIEKV